MGSAEAHKYKSVHENSDCLVDRDSKKRAELDLNSIYNDKTLALQKRAKVVQFILDVGNDLSKYVSIETVRAAVIYFDRYMSNRGLITLSQNEAELMALTCLGVSVKFFEPNLLEFRRMKSICDGRYTFEEFHAAELLMLTALDWNLVV